MTKRGKKLFSIEAKKTRERQEEFAKYEIPSFDLGLNYIDDWGIDKENAEVFAEVFAKNWLENPRKHLTINLKDNIKPILKEGFFEFPSILDQSKKVKFKYDEQPNGKPGHKIALIVLMHWNGKYSSYDKIVRFIRRYALPISTLIHIPAGRALNPGSGEPGDFESVSPNIGKTIFKTRQDVLDIQAMAKYLKQELGYSEVGLLTYSIGSMRGILASIMMPGLFDFAIFHEVCDDFTEAVIGGMATTKVTEIIDGNIDDDVLQKLWSVISPGSYVDYFKYLPKKTRIVPCKYDFVFGPENVKKLIDKIAKERPDVEIEYAPASHTTLGGLNVGPKIMWRNVLFMRENTSLKKR